MNKVGRWMLAGVVLAGGLGLVGFSTAQTADLVFAEGMGETIDTWMTVSPMNEKIVLVPGEVYSGSVSVTNPHASTGNLKYSVSVGTYSVNTEQSDENGASLISFDKKTAYNQMMDWITLDRQGGEIAPNETQEVNYTITVPEDATGGGQYATLIFQNDTLDEAQAEGTVKSNMQIGSVIYATVAGETKEAGKILENSVPGFMLSGPIKTTSLVENDGNVHTRAGYTLQVWPMFGGEAICNNESHPEGELVMPESKEYKVQECEVGPVGIYKAKQIVEIFGESSVVERLVVICPIWLILGVVVVIVAIVLIVWKVRQRRKQRFEV